MALIIPLLVALSAVSTLAQFPYPYPFRPPVAPPFQPIPDVPIVPEVPAVVASPCRQPKNGPKVCGCIEPRTGSHEHNETWISGYRWKMRCNNGSVEIEACIGSRLGNYVEVPVNKSVDVNGFWHKCDDTDDAVKYSQEQSCIVNGEELHINDSFRQNNFQLQCETWGYSIVGCWYRNSTGGDTQLKVGQTADDDILRHFCEKVPQNPGRVRYRVQAVKCKHGGEIYEEGATWEGKHLKYICKADGAIKIINCITNNGTEIAVGQALVIDNVLHRCYRVENTVYYQANGCGFGPACRSGPVTVPDYLAFPPQLAGEHPVVLDARLSGDEAVQFYKPGNF